MNAPHQLPPGFLIRLLEPTDSLRELTELLHRAYAPLAAMGLRFLATWQDEEQTRKRAARGECYVGVLDGRLAATICFRSPAQMKGGPGVWYNRPDVAGFGQFAVEPALQGQGIGAALLDLVERRARETGAAEIACDTAEPAEHLIRLYQRRGYRFIEYVQWDVTNYRSVVLSKCLKSEA